jgi:hypothetical protein
MDTFEASSSIRRFSRHLLLLLFFGSLTCILSYASKLKHAEFFIVLEDIISIIIAVLQAECVVLTLAVVFPYCTRTLNVHAVFCAATAIAWMLIRIHYLDLQRYSLDSLILFASLVFLPLWPILWVQAQYREFFHDIRNSIRYQISKVMNMEINTHLFGDSTVDIDSTSSGRERKKGRVLGLLGLVLTTRFMLSMLRTIGLNDSDIVMLKQYHLQFAEKVIEAKQKYKENMMKFREKRDAALKQKKILKKCRKNKNKPNDLWQRIDGLDNDDTDLEDRTMEEELNRRYSKGRQYENSKKHRKNNNNGGFPYDTDILVEASVVFVSKALGLLMSKLQRHSVTRLDRFAGDIMQSVISNPQTQRRWKQLMSSTQNVVTKNAIRNIESVVVPLPKQIEPTNITKFLTDFVLIELLQRQFFESISRYWIEDVANRKNMNTFTRAFMSIYILARFSINTAKSLIDDKRSRDRRRRLSAANDEDGNDNSYSSPQAIRQRVNDILSHYNNSNSNNNSPSSADNNVDAYNGFELL